MFTKVSVLIPTRHRLERLKTLLESYAQTTDGRSSELVFRVDLDDLETQRFLDAYPQHTCIVGARLEGYTSLPIFFNDMAAVASGDVLLCGNDDMVFTTQGWPDLILAAANQYPNGLFDIGVAAPNEDHYPFSIVSKRAVETMGYLWHPKIFWGDIFLRDVMAFFGRSVKLPSVAIHHDWAGSHPDQVFVEGNAERFRFRGPEYWEHVHQPAVLDAICKLAVLNG